MVKRRTFSEVVINIIVGLLGVICLIPVLNTLAISLSDKTSAMLGQVYFIPKNFNLSAYEEILDDTRFFRAFGVSVVRVILGAGLSTFINLVMAYPVSRPEREFPARKVYMWILVFTMLFNGGMVPTFMVVRGMGLIDSIWALVLPCAVSTFNVLILMNAYRGIPNALCEVATIDGASPLKILFSIYIPLAKASIATILLFSAVNHWNAFFDGKIYINSPTKIPLQTYIQSLSFQVSVETLQNMDPESLQKKLEMSSLTFNAAKAIVSMLPIVIIYPFLQRYFVVGLTIGAVKE